MCFHMIIIRFKLQTSKIDVFHYKQNKFNTKFSPKSEQNQFHGLSEYWTISCEKKFSLNYRAHYLCSPIVGFLLCYMYLDFTCRIILWAKQCCSCDDGLNHGVGNFFRPRAVLKTFSAPRATSHSNTIY